VSELSREEIYQEVGKIVGQFPLLKCKECAETVMAWLKENGIEGKFLRLKTRKRNDFFIVSERYSSNESITDNGVHYGVEVMGLVFDNLSGEGMLREAWIKDFSCRSGEFTLQELESLE